MAEIVVLVRREPYDGGEEWVHKLADTTGLQLALVWHEGQEWPRHNGGFDFDLLRRSVRDRIPAMTAKRGPIRFH